MPMMDFASITYLPDTRSKSKSNLEISLTKDLTLSMELSEICTVFIATILPALLVQAHCLHVNITFRGRKKSRELIEPNWENGVIMGKKAALHNLGCKVNAYELEAMQQLLEKNGYEIVPLSREPISI